MVTTASGRQILAFVLATALAGSSLTLSACGGDDDDETAAAAPQKAAEPAKSIVKQIPSWAKPNQPQAPGTYVGAAGPSRDPFVSVVHQDDQVVVYICDGKRSWDWFGGKVTDSSFDLESEKGFRITGEISTAAITGTLTLPDGKQLRYTTKPPGGRPGEQGLFVGAGLPPDSVRRWISTPYGLRGVDGDGTTKLGVAVTESGGTITDTTGTGGTTNTGGTEPAPTDCKNYITNGCKLSCDWLASMKAGANKAKDVKSATLITTQQIENGCIPNPFTPK